MDDGRVVEGGTHEELMRTGGTYYEMVRRQMESHELIPLDGVVMSDSQEGPPEGGHYDGRSVRL